MSQSPLVGIPRVGFRLIGIIIFERVERRVEFSQIPHNPSIDALGPRHPPVFHHLVEFCGTDADVIRGLIARQSAAETAKAAPN